MSIPLPSPMLSLTDATKELVQLGETSQAKGVKADVKGWVAELDDHTKSIANPDHQAIKALFGEVRVHPLYTLFPEAALSVTAAFLRTISANRLGKYLSRETEDLSHAEITAKTAWEDTYSSILSSITDWADWSDDKNAKSCVGISLYRSIGTVLTNSSSRKLGNVLKKAVLELFENTLQNCKANRPLFIDRGQGVIAPTKLGEILLSKPVDLACHLLTFDIVAHCLPPREKEQDSKQYAQAIFRSLGSNDVTDALETALVKSHKSDWDEVRPKLLSIMAKFDAERLQLVPLTSATRSTKGGTELIVDKGDRSLIKKDRLFLYFDTDNTSFTYTSAGDEDIAVAIPYATIKSADFEVPKGSGQTTILRITDEDDEVFVLTTKCERTILQRICASRAFFNPVKPPSVDLRSAYRASTMDDAMGGIVLPSPTSSGQIPAGTQPQTSAVQGDEGAMPSSQAVRPREERYEAMQELAGSSRSPESGVGAQDGVSNAGRVVKVSEPVGGKKKSTATTRDPGPGPPTRTLSKDVFGGTSSEMSELSPKSNRTSIVGAAGKQAGSPGSKRKKATADQDDPDDTTATATAKKKAKKNPASAVPDLEMEDARPSQPTVISSSLAEPPPKQAAPRTTYGHGGRKRSAPPPSLKKLKALLQVAEATADQDEDEEMADHDVSDRAKQKQATKDATADADGYDDLPASNRKLANPIAKREPPPKTEAKPARPSHKKKVVKEEDRPVAGIEDLAPPPQKKTADKVKAKPAATKKAAPAQDDVPKVTPSRIKAKVKAKKTDEPAHKDSSPAADSAKPSGRGGRASTRKSAVEAKKKIATLEPEDEDAAEDEIENEEDYLADLADRKKPKKVDAHGKGKSVEKKKQASVALSAAEPVEEDGYVYPGDENAFGADDGDQSMDPIPPARKIAATPKKQDAPVRRDPIPSRADSEWLSDVGSRAGSRAKMQEVEVNVFKSKDPKSSKPLKPSEVASAPSKTPLALSRAASKDNVVASPIKRAGSRKSDVAPWDVDMQQQLDANLADAGLEGVLDSPRSEVAPLDSASHRPPNLQIHKPKPASSSRIGPIQAVVDSPDPSNKALSLVSTGSRVRPTDRVVEGEDEHVAATGMATPSMSFSAPQGHSTPKPTSLKQARGTPQPDAVSSTTKPPIKTKPKPRPAMNVTPAPASVKSLKLSVATPIRASSSVVAQAPDPVPAAKVSTPAGLRVEQPVASSSKVGEAGLLGAAVTPRAPKARDVTPAVASRSDRPAAGKENVRDPSAPPSSVKRTRSVLAGVRPDRRRGDVPAEGVQIKETLDAIAVELTKRHVKRVRKTQALAKDTQVRLTGDTQKLAVNLVNRTGILLDASQKHGTVMRELNKNICSTTRDARTKSEKVVVELENVAVKEERRANAWPEGFFA